MTRAALALLLACAPAAAQEAPATSPEPVQRPEGLAAEVEAPSEAAAKTAATADAPPMEAAPAEGIRAEIALDDAAFGACLAALDAVGATYEQVAPVIPEDDPDCGMLRPVSVSAVLDGVALSPAPVLRCPTALGLAEWTRDFVLPAAARLGRGALTEIVGGPGYTCRRRNGQPDGKPSQHSFGNGYDVLGFRFAEGDALNIEPRAREGTLEESFQDAVRAAACMEFTTVLGPGSDDFHDDHLHLDVVARDGGFRLCEQGADESGD